MRRVYSKIMVLSLFIATVIPALAQAPGRSSLSPSAETERRVESIIGRMTLEQKIDLLGGVDDFFIRGFPSLELPSLKMADDPIGVRNFGPATAMAGGIGLAASWNPQLAERVGLRCTIRLHQRLDFVRRRGEQPGGCA